MSFPLLTTKFYFPPVRPNLVPRPRLMARLEEGLKGPLTLISAPAGYGKTTLMCEWRAGAGRNVPAAWLALDVEENDIWRFLLYLATTLDTIQPSLVSNVIVLLESPTPPPYENVLVSLINELSRFPQDCVLVLEDLHVLHTKEVLGALAFLIDHLPTNVHMVLLTRSDPQLYLARLRGQGHLVEIRASDLIFSAEEATIFLNEVVKLELSISDVAALELRTEGWITGLQLAALSMRGRKDTAGFVKTFTGGRHYIVDFLTEEVLDRQPEAVREFLLRTSILERLTGPLCDVLTGHTDGQATLIALEHSNLFLTPLDDEQIWYRYHHLFAEVLRKHLLQTEPEVVPELYRQAAQWFEQKDMHEEAVEYALAAQDYPLAMRLIEFYSWRLVVRSGTALFQRWMRALPQELIKSRLRLCFNYAQALMAQDYLSEAGIFLQIIENALQEKSFLQSDAARELTENVDPFLLQAAGGLTLVERLPILINLARTSIAFAQENLNAAQVLCERLQQQIPSRDLIDHCVAQLYTGSLAFIEGDHSKAAQYLREAARESQIVNHHLLHIEALDLLGLQAFLEGKLHEAQSFYIESVQYAHELPQPIPAEIATVRMGSVQLEWNDLPAATASIEEAARLAEATTDFIFQRECFTAQARLELARGNRGGALDFLQKAENIAHNRQIWKGITPIKSIQARLWISMGNLEAARQWAATAELSPESALHLKDEYNFLTLARLLLVEKRFAEAVHLLKRLQSFTASAGRQGRVIENIMLQALVNQGAGKHELASETLIEALQMALPEGYIRLFVDEGEPMRSLISRCDSRIAKNGAQLLAYVDNLLSAFPPPSKPGIPETQSLIEPLSRRELEVLRLVSKGYNNKEIADQLVIAMGTVKRHTANIFIKLDVRNRTEAVARARELKLL